MRKTCIFKFLFICMIFVIFNQSVLAESVDDITFMTEEYPPFNYTEDGKLKGIAVDLLGLMLKNLNSKLTIKDVKVYPWARGYHMIQRYPNSCLFGMTRTAEREKLFKWVGPFAGERNVLIALKSKKIKIDSIQDLAAYKIGVVRDDIGEQLLVTLGIAKDSLDLVSQAIFNVKKLLAERIDIWAYGDTVAFWLIKHNGFNPDDFEVIYKLDNAGENFFAFNKEIPDTMIQKFQDALDALKKSPDQGKSEYDKIMERYIK